jgi:hypothetical protein
MRFLALPKGQKSTETGVLTDDKHLAATGKFHDRPFSEPKELIAGFWLPQARSNAEAIEWA